MVKDNQSVAGCKSAYALLVYAAIAVVYVSLQFQPSTPVIRPPNFANLQPRPMRDSLDHGQRLAETKNQSLLPINATSASSLLTSAIRQYTGTAAAKRTGNIKIKTPDETEIVAQPTRESLNDTEMSSLCDKMRFMPEGGLPVVALASIPGSGNTWLRYLIERVTGIYTGSIYNDRSLYLGGFKGEMKAPYTGETVVVKMHGIRQPWNIEKVIFLARDLYGAIMADFNRSKGKGHTKVVNESVYHTKAWPNTVKGLSRRWKSLVKQITDKFTNENLLVVRYQDLKTDLPNQLRRIVEFLGLPLDEKRLNCTIQRTEGNFHRPKHALSFDPFQKPLRVVVENAMKETQIKFKQHNLPLFRMN
ncbi:putative WSC domain-containing protein 1 [Apostichopus japonicus]|uniref:Putative WSC domain-containing protein 1 n=1 Tax=Stichopus japonicus TaxID=307972 RepID=A0A2G8JT64_STIJA|nr:putative WSC domain-containing protein 1 [Apostichopus japonicus]